MMLMNDLTPIAGTGKRHAILHGLLGTGGASGGIYVSFLPQVEIWLRLASLVVGLAVGLISLYKLLRKKK